MTLRLKIGNFLEKHGIQKWMHASHLQARACKEKKENLSEETGG